MASLELQRVVKRFGATTVIHGVDLAVRDGEFVVFVGPSGCGKSTLLRMISGLEGVTDGELKLDGRRVNDVSAAQRGLAMVFQSYALYPHMTVYQNMAFGLENIGTPRAEIDAQGRMPRRSCLRLEALLERRPTQLSGGQRQRVAIGRAIVREPTVFLFDEPLSNLDAELRVQMRTEITALHQRLKTTMIYVTHDQVEAMTMADKIVVLRAGRIEQVGAPLELYNAPRNQFVAGFIGSPRMNFLGARATAVGTDGTRISVDSSPERGAATIPVRGDPGLVGQSVTLGIRPEHIHLRTSEPDEISLTATIEQLEQLGATSFLYCALPGGEKLTVQLAGQVDKRAGETIDVCFPPRDVHLFAKTEGEPALERLKPPPAHLAA